MSAAFQAKLALARASGTLSRRSGRGGGTTLPDRVLLRLAPDAIARLGVGLGLGSTIVSATNGKTTTAGMIASALRSAGREPVHNRAGSNMTWGVATALLSQRGEEGLFEVDEAWLPRVAADLRPRLVVLGNLFRDQLDRYGELEHLADEWAAVVDAHDAEAGFVLNADDPLIADLGRDRELRRRRDVTYFGIDDDLQALPELQHAFDAKHCRRCGAPYAYERAFVGHLGHYRCPSCGAERPRPDVAATRIELHGIGGSQVDITTPKGSASVALPLPGLYNVYNALAALAAALKLGVALPEAVAGLEAAQAAFGRVETIEVSGVPLSILLVKNPAGANEVLRTLRLEAVDSARGGSSGGGAEATAPAGSEGTAPAGSEGTAPAGSEGTAPAGSEAPLDLWIALNDRIADGRDISWIWDADFELLVPSVRRVVCAGTRAPEMAVRLKYAGLDPGRIEVAEPIAESLDSALAAASGRVFALPTYTALLELRTLLSRRGLAKEFWA